MDNKKKRRPSVSSPSIESLEPRRLLAAFGTPWPDARNLDISFPADEVQIRSDVNEIHSTLALIATAQQWQELALRAFQTWAVYADINVGLRADHDLPFGTPGLSQNDPRYGDFRIGAFSQTGVLANTLPFQTIAGSWSGDILLNNDSSFNYHDWADQLPPDPASVPADSHDLFSVLLHETGNALGLPDSINSADVMYGHYSGPKGALSPADIANIQALYGVRTDPFELVDNGSLSSATIVPTPVGFNPDAAKISVRGNILSIVDNDIYQHTLITGKSAVTINVNAAGLSFLKPKLEILDGSGAVVASAESSSVFDNDVSLTLDGLSNQTELRIRVKAAQDDLYATGDYELVIDYRNAATRASDAVPGDYLDGIESIGTNFDLADNETDLNDTVLTAIALASIGPFDLNARYETVSGISSVADVDVWKITSPNQASGRLVVNLAGVGLDSPDLQIQILDGNGQNVGARGRLRADGTWVMEVIQPEVDAEYLIRISIDSTSAVSVGNYVMTAEFATQSAQMNDFVSSTVSSEMDNFVRWTSMKTRLYRFDLFSQGASFDEAVKLTVYDAQTQHVVFVMATPSGVTRSAYLMLAEGDYILRFTAVSRVAAPVQSISYTLTADGISDDQDPESGGTDPDYYSYDYTETGYYGYDDLDPDDNYYVYIPWYGYEGYVYEGTYYGPY